MILKGLKGEFGLFSGDGFLLNREYYNMPESWFGTILALRIKGGIKNFDYLAYVF